MHGTKNDLNRLIEETLTGMSFKTAVKLFTMFEPHQIMYIYAMSVSDRRSLLAERTSDSSRRPKQRRNPEQVQKMIDIATDPSNR
ncbi:MAG TPA: hypothetical protein DDZ51_29090 [Planctomycetaceae bacterium]|nr:hypothetical protein [Planctomycetaceae bacterium]